ncbi:hypothetical protein HGM15179_014587 [Zosterops borbonicus]|uniref:Uncharacterized protein n=1 Tax=Zosterops borbonicus TaxID=364589 RepID=A0A8K1G6S7_9PASS|nr:hypothetical protein HGM15179_014587 [Zosterops borbonicus]
MRNGGAGGTACREWRGSESALSKQTFEVKQVAQSKFPCYRKITQDLASNGFHSHPVQIPAIPPSNCVITQKGLP